MNSFERDMKMNSNFVSSFQNFHGVSIDSQDFDEANDLDDDNDS